MGDERRHEAFGAWEPFHEKVAMSLPCRRTVTIVRHTLLNLKRFRRSEL